MLNQKTLMALFCALSMLLALAVFSGPQHAFGQMTIPTRTPVPDGGDPDPEPEPTDDNGGGGDNNPDPTDEPDPGPDPTNQPPAATGTPAPTQPVATAVPTAAAATETVASPATATALATTVTAVPSATVFPASPTPVVTVTAEIIAPVDEVVAFPDSGQNFPQASQCGMPPTFTTMKAISVYAGPGEDYQLVGLLGAVEVRPIVGRAAFARWWVLQLDNTGRIGWVADSTGTIHGFTGRVPIVSAPDINGAMPTRAPAWSPTPDPDCNAPELLAGIVATKAAEEGGGNAGVAAAGESPPSGEPDAVAGLPVYDDVEVIGEEIASGEATTLQKTGEQAVAPGAAGRSSRQAAADPVISELAESAAPLELPAAAAPQLPNLMPVVGLILILLAVFIGLLARRGRSGVSE